MLKTEWVQHARPYDKFLNCQYISVDELLTGVPYPNVTDAMITHYLVTESFVDTRNRLHLGYQDTSEIHAQRIASLINLVRTGVFLNPITIYYDDEEKEIEIDDGWHRMRAFHFLKREIAYFLYFTG